MNMSVFRHSRVVVVFVVESQLWYRLKTLYLQEIESTRTVLLFYNYFNVDNDVDDDNYVFPLPPELMTWSSKLHEETQELQIEL